MVRTLTTLLAVTAVAAVAAASAPAAPSAQRDIVGTAVAAGSFSTLVDLVKRAGLAGALKKPGPYTVFAPTDAAFAKVPKATLNALMKDRSKLRAVLLYHVVQGKAPAAKAQTLSSVKTLNGARLPIRATESGALFVGGAKVTAADVAARNGVIHVVNRVLIPPMR